MKKITNLCLLMATFLLVMTGCSNDDPFTTAGPDDMPRFLAPSSILTSVNGGENIYYDQNFQMEVVVTPVNYTTIQWICDGQTLTDGIYGEHNQRIDKRYDVGTYSFKIIATTSAGNSTYRNLTLTVKAPELTTSKVARWVAPGETAVLEGFGVSKIVSFRLNGVDYEGFSKSGDNLLLPIPADLTTDVYTLTIVDDEDVEWPAGKLTVNPDKAPRFEVKEMEVKALSTVTLTGTNLQKVKTLYLNGEVIEDIPNRDFDFINFEMPTNITEPGDYVLTAVDEDDQPVTFGTETKATLTIPSEKKSVYGTIYEGNETAAWGKRIALDADWSKYKAGDILILTAKDVASNAVFHLIDASWSKPEIKSDITFDGKETVEIVLAEDILSKAVSGGGIGVQGDGFTLTKAAVQKPVITIWEGNLPAPEWGPLWGNLNDKIKGLVANGSITEGTIFTVYGTRTATDYCSIALVNEWWQSVIDGSEGDDRTVLHFTKNDGSNEKDSFTVEAVSISKINDAGFFINGHGFTLTKITIQ